ncbi:hypothetical protein L1987_56812 [Smallanthus sonchifolius]|uniref:Uncharacterized protein n=1 Tax=Smallanthus sonchifolius TaxID=185202 RepID=A0ACB9DB42_9ASTR|nr:hypothetical protein L1987_56812 [Smallanthus sonchifolius]
MENKAKTMVALMVVMGLLVQATVAHPCGSTFFSALVQLIPCRASVAPFSPIPPNEACCTSVKVLGQPCLCVLVNGPPISGVDRSMAMQLPEKCSVNFEPCTNLYIHTYTHKLIYAYITILLVKTVV